MAWTAWCHHSRVHNAAVLWWTKPSLPTDSRPLHASDLTETASRHIGTDAVHNGRCHTDYRHAQPLVCSCCYRHFVVYVCCVSSVNTDYACESGELSLLLCLIISSTWHQSTYFWTLSHQCIYCLWDDGIHILAIHRLRLLVILPCPKLIST